MRKRIRNAGAVCSDGLAPEALKLRVQESDVKRCVVNDQFSALDKRQKFIDDIGKPGFVGEKIGRASCRERVCQYV